MITDPLLNIPPTIPVFKGSVEVKYIVPLFLFSRRRFFHSANREPVVYRIHVYAAIVLYGVRPRLRNHPLGGSTTGFISVQDSE